MRDFYYYNPTKVIFGKNTIDKIIREITTYKKILIISGKHILKINQAYKDVKNVLKKNNISFEELNIVEPNPSFDIGLKIINYIKAKKIDFLLAIGGGSTIDMAKFVSMGVFLEKDNLWEIILKRNYDIKKTIPFGCVVTNFGSGSEMNDSFVISNISTKEKVPFFHYKLFPQFSIVNPTYTYTLNKQQLANGIIDIYIHVLEQYLVEQDELLHDRYCESILKTILDISNKVINSIDYQSRAEIMWCSIQANNKLLSRGVKTDWGIHEIAHQITANYNVTHANSLVLVLRDYYLVNLNEKRNKLSQYGKRVFLNSNPLEAINLTIDFFKSLGMKDKFKDYNLNKKDVYEKLIEYFSIYKPYHFDINILYKMKEYDD